jgi:hypothetical protein
MALYQLIQSRKLLPALDPAPWPEAAAVWREMAEQVQRELAAAAADKERFQPDLPAAIDFSNLTDETARLIYGGVFEASLGPFASWVLGRRGGDHLILQGRFLPAPSLKGAQVRVYLEGVQVDSMVSDPGENFGLRIPIPEALAEHRYVNVRVECDDYAFGYDDFRTLLSLIAIRAAIE